MKLLLALLTGIAIAAGLKNSQLKVLDENQLETKAKECDQSPSKIGWVSEQLKKLNMAPESETTTHTVNHIDKLEVSFGTEKIKSRLLSRFSAEKPIKGTSVAADIKSLPNDEGKFWVFEESDSDTLLRLSFEVKKRRGLGIFVLDSSDLKEISTTTPVPITAVSEDDLKKIKSSPTTELNIEVKSHSEDVSEAHIVLNKKKYNGMVAASVLDCRSASRLLTLLDWIHSQQLAATSTFVFSSDLNGLKEKNPDFYKYPQFEISVAEDSDPKSLARSWYSAEQKPPRSNLKAAIGKLKNRFKEFDGIVDGRILNKTQKKIQELEHLEPTGETKQKLDQIDRFASQLLDLKNIKVLYNQVMRSQWEKARITAQEFGEFKQASLLSNEAFLDFIKARNNEKNYKIDPVIWTMLAEGDKSADTLLQHIEVETDFLEKRFLDEASSL